MIPEHSAWAARAQPHAGQALPKGGRADSAARRVAGTELRSDVGAVRHIQETGDLAHQVLLMGAQLGIGIGHLPHQLDHPLPLLLPRSAG